MTFCLISDNICTPKQKGADELTEDKVVVDNNKNEVNADLATKSDKDSDNKASEDGSLDLSLVAENEKLKAELSTKNDRLLRLQADFDNFRKRAAKERSELAATIEQGFLKDLLPLLDNLSRASSAVDKGEESNVETLRKGVEMIKLETVTALSKHGLEPIDTEGKKFDPNFHQAVGTVKDDAKEDGMIATEFQRGYMARGKVIRPSMVQVVNNS